MLLDVRIAVRFVWISTEAKEILKVFSTERSTSVTELLFEISKSLFFPNNINKSYGQKVISTV